MACHAEDPSLSFPEILHRLNSTKDFAEIRLLFKEQAAVPNHPLGSFSALPDDNCVRLLETWVLRTIETIENNNRKGFCDGVHCIKGLCNFASIDEQSRRSRLFVRTLSGLATSQWLDCFYVFSMAFIDDQFTLRKHLTAYISTVAELMPECSQGMRSFWTSYGNPRRAFCQQLQLWEKFRLFQDKVRRHHQQKSTFEEYARFVLGNQTHHALENLRMHRDRRCQPRLEDWIEFRNFCRVKHEACIQTAIALQQKLVSLRQETELLLERVGAVKDDGCIMLRAAEQRLELLQAANRTRTTRSRDAAARAAGQDLHAIREAANLQREALHAEQELDLAQSEVARWTAYMELLDQQTATMVASVIDGTGGSTHSRFNRLSGAIKKATRLRSSKKPSSVPPQPDPPKAKSKGDRRNGATRKTQLRRSHRLRDLLIRASFDSLSG